MEKNRESSRTKDSQRIRQSKKVKAQKRSTVDVYMQLRFHDIESNISPLRFFSELLGIHSYCNVNYEISIDHYRPPLLRSGEIHLRGITAL